MGLPINHRIDAPMVYVSATSKAWDTERYAREIDLINRKAKGKLKPEDRDVPWETEDDHPLSRYMAGSSRYDIATVRDYFVEGVKPVEFHFRRVRFRQWSQIAALLEQGKLYDARALAISLSLVSVEGADIEFDRGKVTDPLTDDDLDMLRIKFGDKEFSALGYAAIRANSELSDTEKKH